MNKPLYNRVLREMVECYLEYHGFVVSNRNIDRVLNNPRLGLMFRDNAMRRVLWIEEELANVPESFPHTKH